MPSLTMFNLVHLCYWTSSSSFTKNLIKFEPDTEKKCQKVSFNEIFLKKKSCHTGAYCFTLIDGTIAIASSTVSGQRFPSTQSCKWPLIWLNVTRCPWNFRQKNGHTSNSANLYLLRTLRNQLRLKLLKLVGRKLEMDTRK